MNEGLGELKCRRRFVHGGDPCAERAAAVGNYVAKTTALRRGSLPSRLSLIKIIKTVGSVK